MGQLVAADFGPSAIGFDEAYGGDLQYGAGVDGEPARAWDDEGRIYCSTQVALARLGDHIHEQTVRGYTMATVFNKPTSYLTATRADVAMHEYPPWANIEAIEPMRLLLGHKAEQILDWEDMTPEEIREGLRGIYAHIRLSSLRWGAFPMNMQVWGVPDMVALMPVLRALLREGWQADPGFEADERLWLSRYGSGVHTFLVVGNPTRETIGPSIVLRSGGSAEGHLLFCDYDGGRRPIRPDEHGTVELPLADLQPHGYTILRAAVQVLPAEGATGFRAEGGAAMRLDGLTEGSLEADWVAAEAFTGVILVRVPRGATPLRLLIDGEERAFEALDGAVRYEGEVPAECSLQLTWRPAVVVEPTREQIAQFPFVADGEPTATVVLPESPDDRDRYVAEHLSIYFDYWQRRQEQPAGGVSGLSDVEPGPRLPVAEPAQAPADGPRVVLAEAGHPAIRLREDGPILELAGPDAMGREWAMLKLLDILDRHPGPPASARGGLRPAPDAREGRHRRRRAGLRSGCAEQGRKECCLEGASSDAPAVLDNLTITHNSSPRRPGPTACASVPHGALARLPPAPAGAGGAHVSDVSGDGAAARTKADRREAAGRAATGDARADRCAAAGVAREPAAGASQRPAASRRRSLPSCRAAVERGTVSAGRAPKARRGATVPREPLAVPRLRATTSSASRSPRTPCGVLCGRGPGGGFSFKKDPSPRRCRRLSLRARATELWVMHSSTTAAALKSRPPNDMRPLRH